MYKNILIATDGSDLAGKAVDQGLELARALGAHVVFVTVTEMWSALDMAGSSSEGQTDMIEVYEAAQKKSADAILERAAARASSVGVPAKTRHVKDRKAAVGIMETAEKESCDLIVMASHGRRGVKKMLLGSETAEVITLSKSPVLVLR